MRAPGSLRYAGASSAPRSAASMSDRMVRRADREPSSNVGRIERATLHNIATLLDTTALDLLEPEPRRSSDQR